MPSTLKPIGVVLGTPGIDYEVLMVQPTAAQTYVDKDWLVYSGSGTTSVAAAAGNAVGSGKLAGQSLHNAASVLALASGNRRGPMLVPNSKTNFVFPLGGQSAASAPSTGTLALTDVDASTTYDLVRATTGEWMLSTSETSNGKFKIMGLWGEDEKNNNYGVAGYPYVRVKPVLAQFQFGGA